VQPLAADIALTSTAPFDDRDRGRRPEDGWTATVFNGSGADTTFVVHAVCSRKGKFAYRKATDDVPSGAVAIGLAIACPNRPKQSAVGGGVALSASASTIRLRSSEPVDDFIFDPPDADFDEDDGWLVSTINQSGQTITMTGWTICAKKGTYDYEAQGVVGFMGPATFEPDCDPGQIAVGGGVGVGGPDPDMYIQETYPLDDDLDGRPDDGWSGTTRNDSGVAGDMTTSRICRVL
jgi:hypothetical protein